MPNSLDSFLSVCKGKICSAPVNEVPHYLPPLLVQFQQVKKFPVCLHRGKQPDCFSGYGRPSRPGQIPPARTYSAFLCETPPMQFATQSWPEDSLSDKEFICVF